MIPEIKSASDHSMALLMGDKENILKSILGQLFEGIYREIERILMNLWSGPMIMT